MAAEATRGEVRIEELDRPQQVLARRVAEAKAIVPELSMRAEANVARAVAALPDGATVRDLVIKAAALALRETPRANAAYRDGHVELYSRVNVAFATRAGDGAVFPVLVDADARPLADLAAEARGLAEAAAAGTITAPQLGGATFTVVALDEVDEVTPVIAAPQAGTLGAGGVTAGSALTLTLVADARMLHGPVAAGFLGRVRALLESPGELGL
jgi:pyruvate dehydrogenase E2 component (dihydrolipoamide acetyltransferase)